MKTVSALKNRQYDRTMKVINFIIQMKSGLLSFRIMMLKLEPKYDFLLIHDSSCNLLSQIWSLVISTSPLGLNLILKKKMWAVTVYDYLLGGGGGGVESRCFNGGREWESEHFSSSDRELDERSLLFLPIKSNFFISKV